MKKRFWPKYLRALRHLYRLRRTLAAYDSKKAREFKLLAVKHEAEISRRDEIIEALRNKIEIVQKEYLDRTLEAVKLTSVGFATRDVDDRVRDLRYQPFEEKKAEQAKQKGLYFTLDETERESYDKQKEAHWELGHAEGYDESMIKRAWMENEEQVVANIQGWTGMIEDR